MSIQERINKLYRSHSTMFQMSKSNTKYFSNLKKYEIITELHERGVKFRSDASVNILKELLEYEMHGIQRLPALMFTKPRYTLEELNLSRYEILSNEPLHDVSNHVKNIYSELPHHFNKKEKKLVVIIQWKRS